MARGGASIKKRPLERDPLYGSALVAKFMNNIMQDGKKTTAQNVMYNAFEILKTQGHNPLEIFEKAIEVVGPKTEVRARRIGGAAYQVPTEVRGPRRTALAIRWILEAAHKRSTAEYKGFSAKLAAELLDATNNAGDAVRKRDTVLKMADANKAFAHFRW